MSKELDAFQATVIRLSTPQREVVLPKPDRSAAEIAMTPTERKRLMVFSTMEACTKLREELESAGQKFGFTRSGTWKHIAEELSTRDRKGVKVSGPSFTTIQKIAEGSTMWPRFSTIQMLFGYFGYELTWVRKG